MELEDSGLVSFVSMADVDEVLGRITGSQSRPFGEVKKRGTPFRDRDVLFAKITLCMQNGKVAIVSGLIGGFGFGVTEFHMLRAGPEVTPEYLFALVRLQSFRNFAMSAFIGSAGQKRGRQGFCDNSDSLFRKQPICTNRRPPRSTSLCCPRSSGASATLSREPGCRRMPR